MLSTILKAIGTFLMALLVLFEQKSQGRTEAQLETANDLIKKQSQADVIDSQSLSVGGAIDILRSKAGDGQ